ncbi:brevican core protein-like isoform X7 [Falco cherrug]|uniref:brevican core protein-like isoform X7 n=1 Tax=Falco cherrug TaxID=345164 RepID=UPI00247836AC|nr:brevican core protein-like isoform X7 [Falco cherrug]
MGKSLVPFPMPDWSPSSSFPAPQSQPSTPITTPALSVGTLAWGQHFGDTGTMYGNLESSQAGQGQVSVLGPGREACSTLCPTEENLYEPLDPTSTVPGQKHVPDPGTPWARARASSAGKTHAVFKTSGTQLCPNWEPVTTHPPSPASRCCSGKKLVLVGAAVLGVSVLMNILFLTIGSQRTPGHPVPCGDPPVSPCPPAVTALTSALEAEKEKQLSNVGCPPCSKGWTYFRNSCYFYSKTPSSWENAQRFCSVLGTQLLEVDGAEEKDHIQTMLKSSSWLGIRDEEVEGTWKRANGTILPRESSWWHRNEPNGGHQENCAAVREDGEWYDYPCTSQLPWVCEGHP